MEPAAPSTGDPAAPPPSAWQPTPPEPPAEPAAKAPITATPPPSPTVAWEAGASRPTEVPGSPGFVFAPILARVVGYIIDSVILSLIGLFVIGILLSIVGMPFDLQDPFDPATVVDPLPMVAAAAISVVVSWVYFVGFWRSGQRATPGQRLVSIQVGRAFDGRTLTIEQATSRWFALALPFQLFTAVPAVANLASGLILLWSLVLLIATAASGTRQGPHDHFARSAVVQRAGAGQSGVVLGCILVIAIIGFAFIASIVALIFLGSQISEILSTVGESI